MNKKIIRTSICLGLLTGAFMMLKRLIIYGMCPSCFAMPEGIAVWYMEQAVRADWSVLAAVFAVPVAGLLYVRGGGKGAVRWFVCLACCCAAVWGLELYDGAVFILWGQRIQGFAGYAAGIGGICLGYVLVRRYESCFWIPEKDICRVRPAIILYIALWLAVCWCVICGFTPTKGPFVQKRVYAVCDAKEQGLFITNAPILWASGQSAGVYLAE